MRLSSHRFSKVTGNFPEGLSSPKSVRAIAVPASWPPYHAHSSPFREGSQLCISTLPPALTIPTTGRLDCSVFCSNCASSSGSSKVRSRPSPSVSELNPMQATTRSFRFNASTNKLFEAFFCFHIKLTAAPPPFWKYSIFRSYFLPASSMQR